MPRPSALNPFRLLKNADSGHLADFLEHFEEGIQTAFIDSNRRIPAGRLERPAVNARGNHRRWRLDRAFRRAAKKAGMTVTTGASTPPTWTFPILRTGVFSITLGIVDRHLAQGVRRMRCKGTYMKRHAARNGIMNPQASLPFASGKVRSIIPPGSIGAVIVIESSLYQPDQPRYIGFWIPSPNLSKPFFRAKLDDIIASLRRHADTITPEKVARRERIKLVRKPPARKLPRRKNGRT